MFRVKDCGHLIASSGSSGYHVVVKLAIFYAWQSDTDRDLNHRFIRRAADAAINKLKLDAELEDAPDLSVELDHDTKGVTGTPHIAETIKTKIRSSTIFLADVTHVAHYTTTDGRKKYSQNPNVLIELGLALADKGPNRIVLVQNKAFGPPEELPFDLRHHRFPIAYSLANARDASASQEFRSLVDTLVRAFKPLIHAEQEKARAEARRAADEVAAARNGVVRRRREDFDRAIAQDKYKTFNLGRFQGGLERIGRPFITVSIFPVVPPTEAIDLSKHYSAISRDLRPLFVTGHETEIFSDSVVSHASRTIPLGIDDHNIRFTEAIVEVTADGCIFVAEELLPADQEHAVMRPPGIDIRIVERQLLTQLCRYIQMLKGVCGVAPPLLIALSILKPTGLALRAEKFSGTRGLREDILASPVLLEDGIDISDSAETFAAIAKSMRPSFDLIWRSAGSLKDPFYDDEGRFHG